MTEFNCETFKGEIYVFAQSSKFYQTFYDTKPGHEKDLFFCNLVTYHPIMQKVLDTGCQKFF